MLEISTASLVYVKVPISATKGGVVFDPSVDTVQMAFTASEHIGDTPTWCDATWEDGANGVHLARCLVGPTGEVELTAGTHWVHVKVTDTPEAPVVPAGPIRVV